MKKGRSKEKKKKERGSQRRTVVVISRWTPPCSHRRSPRAGPAHQHGLPEKPPPQPLHCDDEPCALCATTGPENELARVEGPGVQQRPAQQRPAQQRPTQQLPPEATAKATGSPHRGRHPSPGYASSSCNLRDTQSHGPDGCTGDKPAARIQRTGADHADTREKIAKTVVRDSTVSCVGRCCHTSPSQAVAKLPQRVVHRGG